MPKKIINVAKMWLQNGYLPQLTREDIGWFWKSLRLLMEVTTTVVIGLKNLYVQKSKSKKILSGLILLQIRKILVTYKSFS